MIEQFYSKWYQIKPKPALSGEGFYFIIMEEVKLVRHPETNEIIPEVWKDIEGYNGMYEVSNYGRVKSNYSDRILKQAIDNRGYYRCSLSKNDTLTTYKVHRLVAEYFVENPENKPEVNHKNGNKLDNRAVYIEWCTKSENMIHAVENRLVKTPDNTGDNHGMSKLTEEDVLRIRDINPSSFNDKKKLANDFGVSFTTIYDILNRRSWRHL